MYNPTIKEIKPLQCFKCGNLRTTPRPFESLNLVAIECQKCSYCYMVSTKMYKELLNQFLKYKLELIANFYPSCKN